MTTEAGEGVINMGPFPSTLCWKRLFQADEPTAPAFLQVEAGIKAGPLAQSQRPPAHMWTGPPGPVVQIASPSLD